MHALMEKGGEREIADKCMKKEGWFACLNGGRVGGGGTEAAR